MEIEKEKDTNKANSKRLQTLKKISEKKLNLLANLNEKLIKSNLASGNNSLNNSK